METYFTNREIISEFCHKEMHAHTDWSGTRVETDQQCEHVDDFVDKLVDWIKENSKNTTT